MSAGRHLNQMRMQALLAAGKLGAPKHGLVSSYDPAGYQVKVRLQPEDIETGWMPITTLLAGSGFGAYFGPSQNDQAVVLFQEDDREVGFCVGFLNSDADPAPAVQSGEIHLRAKAHGALVTLLQDGSINAETGSGGSRTSLVLKPDGTIASAGSWTHTGTMHITQDVTVDTKVTATNDVIGGGKHLATHTHGGVQTGGGNTAGPN